MAGAAGIVTPVLEWARGDAGLVAAVESGFEAAAAADFEADFAADFAGRLAEVFGAGVAAVFVGVLSRTVAVRVVLFVAIVVFRCAPSRGAAPW